MSFCVSRIRLFFSLNSHADAAHFMMCFAKNLVAIGYAFKGQMVPGSII